MTKSFTLAEYLQDLEFLVNIDSGSYTPAGTKKVMEFFQEKFNLLGWNTKIHKTSDKVGPCLQISNCPGEEYDVLLLGHMDTVFSEGTAAQRPYAIDKKRKVTGAGVSDMKGCLLMTYFALKELDQSQKLTGKRICFLLNSDEEIGSLYSRTLIETLAKKSNYALVVEAARPTGDMVNSRSGIASCDLTATGIAAHAGVNPQDGSSAINELAAWILKLHALSNYELGTSINVGIIKGGSARNVVAEQAQAQVDIRFKQHSEFERISTALHELEQQSFTAGGAKITCNTILNRPPMNPSPQTLKLCKNISDLGKSLGIDFNWVATGGGSDGNYCAALGIPTVDGLGPVGGGGHSIHEWLDANSIKPRLNLLIKTIEFITNSPIK